MICDGTQQLIQLLMISFGQGSRFQLFVGLQNLCEIGLESPARSLMNGFGRGRANLGKMIG